MVRWGVIGTGSIARVFAADLAFSDSGEVVAVGSRSRATADRFADELGVAGRYDTYEALVAAPEVDAVYVATPHPMHHAHACLAIDASKAVLVEKPCTMNADEALDLVRAARARDVFLMEAMWTRFLPPVAQIRRLVANGTLGEIVSVHADHGAWFPEDAGSRLFAPELGGGALLDLGVYAVSFASMVLGTPERIVALHDPAFTGVDTQTSMLFGHARGAQAVLTCTLAANGPTRAAIVGTAARIEIERPFYAPTAFTLIPRDGEAARSEWSREGVGLHHQADEVARCLAEGLRESPLMPVDESVSVMATMDAVVAQAACR